LPSLLLPNAAAITCSCLLLTVSIAAPTVASACCHLLLLQGLQAALQELSHQEGWPTTHLPSANQLKAVDRTDLVRVSQPATALKLTAWLSQLHLQQFPTHSHQTLLGRYSNNRRGCSCGVVVRMAQHMFKLL
jgi:hypothetical protein